MFEFVSPLYVHILSFHNAVITGCVYNSNT